MAAPDAASTPAHPPKQDKKTKLTSAGETGPTPELPENAKTRSYVVLSFWLVVLLLGLPLWWITTAIYRAPLPLKEMQSWADGRACRAEFPLLVDVEAPTLSDPEHLIKSAQHALDDANDFSAHHLRLKLASSKLAEGIEEEENIAAILRLLPGPTGSPHSYQVHNSSRVIDLFYSPSYNPSSSASFASLSLYVANTLQEIFAEEQQMISHLLSSSIPAPSPAGDSSSNGGGSKVNHAEITRKMSRILRYAPTYHLTFSLFTGSGNPTSWEIEDAIEEYLQPLLNALSGISNFTVDSQIQFYASLSDNVVPEWQADGNVTEGESTTGKWMLKKEDLSSFINSAEWPLASITSYPTINFIIYVPSEDLSPLAISGSATNAFLLPQWGGVKILNLNQHSGSATTEKKTHLTKQDLRSSLDTFAAQLLSLLGAPSHPSSLPIRLDSLTRQRSAELLTSASSTLGSLYRLTLALPSISIPSSVSTSVSSTLQSLHNACRELKQGRVGGEGGALAEGRNAAAQAEKAFFEKSMVGQVYFPEEHKVAVYLPLMGPVGVPMLMSAAKEISRIVRAWKERRRTKV